MSSPPPYLSLSLTVYNFLFPPVLLTVTRREVCLLSQQLAAMTFAHQLSLSGQYHIWYRTKFYLLLQQYHSQIYLNYET